MFCIYYAKIRNNCRLYKFFPFLLILSFFFLIFPFFFITLHCKWYFLCLIKFKMKDNIRVIHSGSFLHRMSTSIETLRFPLILFIICLHCYTSTSAATRGHDIYFRLIYPSLVSLVFMSIGYYTRQKRIIEATDQKIIILAIISWFVTFMFGKVEMSHCLFKLNIIDFAGSISGTFIFYKLSQKINTNNAQIIKDLKAILVFTGRYSLVILFFHTIDYCVYPWYVLEPYISNKLLLLTLITINRFLFVYICVTISINSKILRSFFSIKH